VWLFDCDMYGANLFKIISLFSIFTGLGLLMSGVQQMMDSGYRPPTTPAGWTLGIFWISVGGIIAWTWTTHMLSALIVQKCNRQKRWSFAKIISSSIFLVGAMSITLLGTWLTWKYPYKLGPCDCTDTQWGPLCKPCLCDFNHGVCDWGVYGTGTCLCDPQWGGSNCSVCADRWKPEPSEESAAACNLCKTGYAGEKCEDCAKGYSGEDCSVCAAGWRPWFNTSLLFSESISADDNRHICDECLPNHFGYYCTRCPYGNDVPQITLEQNDQLVNGTMVQTTDNEFATIHTIGNYDASSFSVLDTPLTLTMEKNNAKKSTRLKNIKSVKCNNRGTCQDDVAKFKEGQRLKGVGFCASDITQSQNNCPSNKWTTDKYPWEAVCTSTNQACSSHLDCLNSENCRGKCRGVDLPVDSVWFAQFNGNICATDSDCAGTGDYKGGKCMDAVCCEESHHGSGNCECDSNYFGEQLEDNALEHYQMSPACDFCPGYDWLTGKQNSICSGNKGTCTPSYARIALDGRGGQYQKMRCTCGEEVYTDPITKIVYPDKIIAWSGDLCQCGDWNEDALCDQCADGFWGPDCKTCPGGAGVNQCSRHGKCNAGVDGDGHCNCDISEDNAWMLAPFARRYATEIVHTNANGSNATCIECAPQYWGDKCQKCNGMEQGDGGGRLPLSQLQDVFQPNVAQLHTTDQPQSICNRGFCYIACSRGGWCNWGRKGDGRCSCWSNSVLESNSWNPLDNVCIGNNRSATNQQKDTEACASYGRCYNDGINNARTTKNTCGSTPQWLNKTKDTSSVSWNRNPYVSSSTLWSPYDDWVKQGDYDYNQECLDKKQGDTCIKWQPISWTKTKSLRTCREQ